MIEKEVVRNTIRGWGMKNAIVLLCDKNDDMLSCCFGQSDLDIISMMALATMDVKEQLGYNTEDFIDKFCRVMRAVEEERAEERAEDVEKINSFLGDVGIEGIK